uniref:Uncharacterized protein n=1 Tax=Melopsittacus undulatus TaxID=13146 RepID=A0A8C6JYP5_MELUD
MRGHGGSAGDLKASRTRPTHKNPPFPFLCSPQEKQHKTANKTTFLWFRVSGGCIRSTLLRKVSTSSGPTAAGLFSVLKRNCFPGNRRYRGYPEQSDSVAGGAVHRCLQVANLWHRAAAPLYQAMLHVVEGWRVGSRSHDCAMG